MKSKVENGEVIEEFRKQKHWGALMYEVDISIVQDIMKREEAFITNALNQQREEILGEIKKEIMSYHAHGYDFDGDRFNDLIKFLTKLEE